MLKSIPALDKINLWPILFVEYGNFWSTTVPSLTSKSKNEATPSITGFVMSFVMPKTKDWPPNWDVETTGPFFKVIVVGGGVIPGSTVKFMLAVDAYFDLGTYPMFLASATTFSLSVALSIKTSFEIILALYEVM